MTEIEDLLNGVREDEPRPDRRRGGRIALLVAGIGLVGAVAAGSVLAVSATASIAAAGLGPAAEPAPEDGAANPVEAVTPSVVADPPPPPGSAAPADEPAIPVYDASSDITTIPRPPADWPESELANAEVWLEQQGIIGDCMAEQGHEYRFTPWWLVPPGERAPTYSENWDGDFGSPAGIALDGHPDRGLGDDYDWRTAGCIGYAVHVTGMDNAN